jgi:hypothetical protein
MAFKTLDSTNTSRGTLYHPIVTLCDKKASVLSPAAVALMEVKKGGKIAFTQDEENTRDWYISKNKNGFLLSVEDKRGKNLNFSCRNAVRQIQESLDNHKVLKCKVGSEFRTINNQKCWPLLVITK